jgi:3-oxoacyl-ACP reductase-like protein
MLIARCLLLVLSSTLVSCFLQVPNPQNAIDTVRDGFQSLRSSALDSAFLNDARQLRYTAQKEAREMLQQARIEYKDVGDKLLQIQRDAEGLVAAAVDFKALSKLKHGFNMDAFSDELSKILDTIQHELSKQFPSPNDATGHDARVKMVDEALAKMREAILRLVFKYDIPKDKAESILNRMIKILRRILITTV